nr:hypothetical protein [Tanacetum cinerariifolium]
MNFIPSRDGRLPGYEVINDDFCESGVIHLIASFLTFVLHLIHKVLPDQIGKVDVDSVIESPKYCDNLKLSTPELLPVRYLLITEANDLQVWKSRTSSSVGKSAKG